MNQDKELVSIIIPAYNVEKYIERCLHSITGQTYQAIEIIVVDDGSTDSTGEILDRYAISDSRMKVIHTKNGGVSAARNIGLENAGGEFLSFVDADDLVAPHYIERLMEILQITGTDISTCCAVDVSENSVSEHWPIPLSAPIVLEIAPRGIGGELFDYSLPSAHNTVWGGYTRKMPSKNLSFA